MTSEPITTKGYCAMQTQIKVRGYHLDVYQHVNNARYLEFLEEARWDGLENSESFLWLTAHNIAFVVVNININYRRPAVLGDVLTVTSEVQQLNGKSGVLSRRYAGARRADCGRCADHLCLYRSQNPESVAAGRGVARKAGADDRVNFCLL